MKTYSTKGPNAAQMGANPRVDLQQELDQLKHEVLEECRYELSRDLDAKEHFPFLQSVRVLEQRDCELIENEIASMDRASRLIDILLKKGPRGFDMLCEALRKNGTQIHLLRTLNEKLEHGRSHIFAQRDPGNNFATTAELQLPTPEQAGIYVPDDNNSTASFYSTEDNLHIGGASENEMNIPSKDEQ